MLLPLKFQRFLFLGLFLASPGLVFAENEFHLADGPIELRDQHPLSLLHTTFRPQDASIPPIGTLRMGGNFSWSNTFNYKPDLFRVDTETRVLDLFARYGLTEGLELQFSQNIIWRGSGESDSLISQFHQTFGLPDANSDEVPQDEFVINGVNEDGSTWKISRDGVGLSGFETALKYSPSDQSAHERWAVLLGIGLPTGTSEYSQDGVDLQLGIYGQAGFDELEFYGGAALLYYDDTQINNLSFPSFQYAGFLGVQYPLHSSISVYVGGHLASILLEGVPGYPDYQTYVDFGLRSLLSESLVFDVAVRENVLHSQGTTDITLMFGLTYKAG